MHHSPISRRQLLRQSAAASVVGAIATGGAQSVADALPARPAAVDPAALRALETRSRSRLGVWAVNHRTGRTLAWRADERFPFCSAYKGLLAAHVLADVAGSPSALNRVVPYPASALIEGSPVTSAFQSAGLTVRSLCAAAIAYSDNTAANLLFELSGGPAGLQRFLRSLGDTVTNSDRTEPTLNRFGADELRDTTTPRAIGQDTTRVLLGDALSAAHRTQLRVWMEGDAVNVARFRAGLPASWTIADKTGTGFTQIANDVGVAWTPRGTPLTVAVLTEKQVRGAEPDSALVAAAARIVATHLAPEEL